jgi:hypothetical protein
MFVFKAAVVGAGTMGGQIAQTIAAAGIPAEIVPKNLAFYSAGFMELPAGLFGGSSWDGHDTTRCGSSRVHLSVYIKGTRKRKVCKL